MNQTGKAPKLFANGANIPAIGLGTYRMRDADCARAVETAIAVGYRHVDTAAMYGNEAAVGAGLKASGLARDELFVTTKVWHDDIGAGDLQKSAGESVKRLGLEQVDLLLIHWPNKSVPLSTSIAALCDARKQGLTRHIGVANFPAALLDLAARLAESHGHRLVVNQCEYHPRLDQTRLLAACRKLGVLFTSYCPVGQGTMVSDPAIVAIARRLGKTPAQVVLRWHMQQPGVAAIPKSSQLAHLKENIDVFDFSLTDADMAALFALAAPNGRLVQPGFAPDWD